MKQSLILSESIVSSNFNFPMDLVFYFVVLAIDEKVPWTTRDKWRINTRHGRDAFVRTKTTFSQQDSSDGKSGTFNT